MMIGKNNGNHFCLCAELTGVSVYFPETRFTFAVALGASWRLLRSGTDELLPGLRPCFTIYRMTQDGPLWWMLMKHLRAPYTRIELGTW